MKYWRPWTPACGDIVRVRDATQRRRPALVLSPAAYSARVGLALVCPIVSEPKGYPFEVALPPGLAVRGVVVADRVASIDWQACGARLAGAVGDEVVTAVRERILPLLAE
ncbi:MAG TPA: type II toxin-antitoxin system PemK/MazF family toxin [Thermoleophilia bacterium]|nr:type II toxin-antitoxin system PemK/MazF family toxin [Thermoleophilia bacterium]